MPEVEAQDLEEFKSEHQYNEVDISPSKASKKSMRLKPGLSPSKTMDNLGLGKTQDLLCLP